MPTTHSTPRQEHIKILNKRILRLRHPTRPPQSIDLKDTLEKICPNEKLQPEVQALLSKLVDQYQNRIIAKRLQFNLNSNLKKYTDKIFLPDIYGYLHNLYKEGKIKQRRIFAQIKEIPIHNYDTTITLWCAGYSIKLISHLLSINHLALQALSNKLKLQAKLMEDWSEIPSVEEIYKIIYNSEKTKPPKPTVQKSKHTPLINQTQKPDVEKAAKLVKQNTKRVSKKINKLKKEEQQERKKERIKKREEASIPQIDFNEVIENRKKEKRGKEQKEQIQQNQEAKELLESPQIPQPLQRKQDESQEDSPFIPESPLSDLEKKEKLNELFDAL